MPLSDEPAPDGASDADLLRLFQKGSEEAFLLLYQRHQGPVFRFALHIGGNREIAEEVTQEVFLGLLSKNCGYDAARGSLQAYLIGAARHHLRRQTQSAAAMPDDPRAAESAPLPANMSVDELVREQDLANLRCAILSLPLNYREVIVLCDMEELDYAEVARQLACAVGTVRSRLHRARAILLEKMRRHQTTSKREACSA